MKKRGRGRPKGFRLSEESKEKIRRSRTGTRHSEETKEKIAMALNGGKLFFMQRFVEFATIYIIKAARTRSRNPIMQNIVNAFCEEIKEDKASTVEHYAVKYRVCLEECGLISVANVNVLDRRIRFINPTPLFPSSLHATKQIRTVNSIVIEYIRNHYRLKDRKRRAQKGMRQNRRFKYFNK